MFLGCYENSSVSSLDEIFSKADSVIPSSVIYADGFDIYEKDGIKKLVIYNPQNKEEVLVEYFLFDSLTEKKYGVNSRTIKIPCARLAVFSATQLNAISKLDKLENVIAISESEYIQNTEVRSLINEGKIVNLASNGNFYLEKTLQVSPSIIFYSPYNLAQRHPLAETNLTMIPFFDFMESDPLGRAEWIKFSAIFFGEEKLADLIFDSIESKYNYYKKVAFEAEKRPTVFSDKYYSGQWYVPGGESYIAQLFSDAGADYIWRDNNKTASVNLDFEVVYNKAHNADFWRIVGAYDDGFSYEKLGSEYELYKNFDAFKNHKVIFCDSRKSNYFETGTLEPHLVLADLIYAFHPKLIHEHKPVYYSLYD